MKSLVGPPASQHSSNPSPSPKVAGVRSLIADGIASWVMATLMGNPFLVALALGLGANNLVIGILAAIPPLMHLLQIPAIELVERVRRRRWICAWGSGISRSMLLVIAALPWLGAGPWTVALLVLATIVQSGFAAVSVCSWNSWMRDFLPDNQRGTVYSQRLSWAFLLSSISSILAAVFLDFYQTGPKDLSGYSFIFLAAYGVGMLGLIFMLRIPEPSMPARSAHLDVWKAIREPFKDENFKNLLIFTGTWSFAAQLAAPFFSVYLLRILKFDMSSVIGFTILSQLANFWAFRHWGPLSDRFSNKTILGVTGPFFIFGILGWTFTTMPDRHALTIPLLIVLHAGMGVATAGIQIATQNIALKLAPRDKATSYLATNSLVTSFAQGSAPLLGGLFADYFAKRELSWTVRWSAPGETVVFRFLDFSHWDFFFFIAFLVGLYSLHRLAYVKEVGEVEEKVVIDEVLFLARKDIQTLTTVSGLRAISRFPSSLIRRRRRR